MAAQLSNPILHQPIDDFEVSENFQLDFFRAGFRTLADALQQLLQDAELRKQFGANGRQLALEKFTQETVIQQTMKVYQSLLQA